MAKISEKCKDVFDKAEWVAIATSGEGGPYGSGGIKYAKWDGAQWLISWVDYGGFIGVPSIAIDTNGYPHISYITGFHSYCMGLCDISYVRWDGTKWLTEIVDLGRYNQKVCK